MTALLREIILIMLWMILGPILFLKFLLLELNNEVD